MAERAGQVNPEGRPDRSMYPGGRAELVDPQAEVTDETAAIKADIERTRVEMSGTIAALQEKLNPEVVKHEVAEKVREQVREHLGEAKAMAREQLEEAKVAVREQIDEAKMAVREATVGRVEHMIRDTRDRFDDAKGSFIDTVRANPIPAAMVGIGLAWLLMGNRRERRYGRIETRSYQRRYEYDPMYAGEMDVAGIGAEEHEGMLHRAGDRVGGMARDARNGMMDATHRVGEAATHAKDRAGELVGQAKSAVGDYSEQARHRADEMAHQARMKADHLARQARTGLHQAEDRVEGMYETSPLGLAAVALATGVAVGLALPRTEREDMLLGEARDQLLEKAQQVASETIDKAQEAALNAGQKLTDKGGSHWQERAGQA